MAGAGSGPRWASYGPGGQQTLTCRRRRPVMSRDASSDLWPLARIGRMIDRKALTSPVAIWAGDRTAKAFEMIWLPGPDSNQRPSG